MTGLADAGRLPPAQVLLLVLLLAVTAGVGSVLRAVVLDRAQRSGSWRVRSVGSGWVNVPAAALAAAALVVQVQLELFPGRASIGWVLAVVAVLGLCGGVSTYSTLSLEVSRAVLAARWAEVRLQLGGVVLGVLGGLAGAGGAALALLTVG